MQNSKTETPIFTDPFSFLEREFISLWEAWDTMPDNDERDRVADEIIYLAEVLGICNFEPESY